jgi:transcriptional regulator with XRE-family HTH domain
MPTERIEIRRPLRRLIRLVRTDRAGLTQREAASTAGLSEIWWRHIEGGHTDIATADTLARMAYAIGVTPDQLRHIDEAHIADLVEERMQTFGRDVDDMESYLMKTPDLSDEQRAALVTMARALRGGK